MIILLSALFLIGVSSKTLPPDIEKCSRSDPNLNSCLSQKIIEAVRKLRPGNKDLGLVRLEPFFIKKLAFGDAKSNSGVSLRQEYENMNMFNSTTGIIVDIDVNLGENVRWKFKTKTAQVKMEADYKMEGQLLVFPINGHGKCSIELYDIDSFYDFKLDRFVKNNKKHLRVTEFTLKVVPKRGTFEFDNIVEGNEVLSREVVKTMNENFSSIYADVGKYFDEALGVIWKESINRVFARVPEEELFLP